MKVYRRIAIVVMLLLLSPMVLSASESMNITTEVPNRYIIDIEANEGGTYTVGGKEYSENNSFVVDRFDAFTIDVVPKNGYLAAVYEENRIVNPFTENQWIFSDIVNDRSIRITFEPDPSFQLMVLPPENCIVGINQDQTLVAQAFGYEPLTYLWEVSNDGGDVWKSAGGVSNQVNYEITGAQLNPNGENRPYLYRLTVTDANRDYTACTCEVLVTDSYLYRTLTYTKDVISVSTYMHNDASLKIKYLDQAEDGAMIIMANLGDEMIPLMICDVKLEGKNGEEQTYFGDLLLRFYVGDTFNGQTLRVFHMHEDGIKTHLGFVEDGYMTIIVDSLSVFMVEAPGNQVYDVNVLPSEHGLVNPAGVVHVGMNANVLFEFEPSFGYHVEECFINNIPVEVDDNHYLLEDVARDSSIKVIFARQKGDHAFFLTLGICVILALHISKAIINKVKKLQKKSA